MDIEDKNRDKNYLNFIEIFESIAEEKKCMIGESLSSFETHQGKVFLIKEGNARLTCKINNKLVSVAKSVLLKLECQLI